MLNSFKPLGWFRLMMSKCAASAPPLPSVVAYLKMNEVPGWDIESISLTSASAITPDFIYFIAGGKFNGCVKTNGATDQFMEWLGSDAASFMYNFKSRWTYEFFFMPAVDDAGGFIAYFSDTPYSGGADYVMLSVVYEGGQWVMKLVVKKMGATVINVSQACTDAPQSGTWKHFRFAYNGARVRLANESSVIYASNHDFDFFPNFVGLGMPMVAHFRLLGADDAVDNVALLDASWITDDLFSFVPPGEY